jgi:hypothetical protein
MFNFLPWWWEWLRFRSPELRDPEEDPGVELLPEPDDLHDQDHHQSHQDHAEPLPIPADWDPWSPGVDQPAGVLLLHSLERVLEHHQDEIGDADGHVEEVDREGDVDEKAEEVEEEVRREEVDGDSEHGPGLIEVAWSPGEGGRRDEKRE